MRNGDLEAISRHMDRKGESKKDRIAFDPTSGKRVVFDVSSKGYPKIKAIIKDQ